MLVRQNSFVFLEKNSKATLFPVPEKEIYPFLIGASLCCSAQPKRGTRHFRFSKNRGFAIDEESKSSYESRPNYISPLIR